MKAKGGDFSCFKLVKIYKLGSPNVDLICNECPQVFDKTKKEKPTT